MISKKLLSGVALAALSLSFGVANAQETTSAVRGEVTATDGAPIVGAQVTLTHVPSGTRANTVSGANGGFDARGLRVGGPYTLEVTAPDHQGERVENVYLSLGDIFRITVDLEPSEDEIIVMATAVRRGVDGAGPITSLSREDIEAVPSLNRDVRDLARRDPLVSQDVGANRGGGGPNGISIAGSSPRSNRITIDGMGAGDDFGLNTGGLSSLRGPVNLGAIQEFAVQAVPFDVEEGDFTGGALAIVLRQGGNELEGNLFINYLNDGMVGKRIDGRIVNTIVSTENYGGFLSGPIIKDTLFFAVSAENYFSFDVSPRGIGGVPAGFANSINGFDGAGILTDAAFTANFLDAYDNYAVAPLFPAGITPQVKPVQDTKWSARIDWNISANHRANFTYRESESEITIRNLIGNATSAGLDSTWYLAAEQESVSTFQLNSDWTPNFSTEARVSYRWYERQQMPPAGQDFAEVDVCFELASGVQTGCDANVPTVFFGPDQFRAANYLQTDNTQAQFSGEYSIGDHVIKAGAQYQGIGVFNLFVPQSEGLYNFDGVDTFGLGLASRFRYTNTASGDPNAGAAEFKYAITSVFLQDSWDITEDLTLIGGIRYDYYTSDDAPANNPNFLTRNGFRNDGTYDGLDVIMPRVSFEYTPTERLQVSGGIGLVSGGLPDVFISNSFGNTGFLTSGIDVTRTSALAAPGDPTCTENSGIVLTAAQCAQLLNLNTGDPSTFFELPGLAQQLVGGLQPNPNNETNALAPDFEMVSDWRGAFKVNYDVTDNIRVGLDVVGVYSNDGLAFRDERARLLTINGVQQRTPDGRVRYDGLSLTAAQRTALGIPGFNGLNIPGGGNRDIVAFNPDDHSWIVTTALSISGQWDNGISGSLAYVHTDSDVIGAFGDFSTTASGAYADQYAALDPNNSTGGRFGAEIEDAIKISFDWSKHFFGDLETRVSLFGEWREGRPINFLFSDPNSGRSRVFGVNRGGNLLYVPDLDATRTVLPGVPRSSAGAVIAAPVGDTSLIRLDGTGVIFAPTFNGSNVSRTAAQNLQNFINIVNAFGLPQGGIVDKGAANNPEVTQFDLQFMQELPGLRDGHRFQFTVDVTNFLNLLNDEWGVVTEYTDSRTGGRVVDVMCGSNTGEIQANSSATCEQYIFFNTDGGPGSTGTFGSPNLNPDESRWVIQLGLRYQF